MQKTQTQTRTRINVNAALVELFSFSCHVESYVFTCVLFVVVSERLLLKESAMNFRVFLRVGLAKIPYLSSSDLQVDTLGHKCLRVVSSICWFLISPAPQFHFEA